MRYTNITECLDCGKIYDRNEHADCPDCVARYELRLALAANGKATREVFDDIVTSYVQKLGHHDGPVALTQAYLDFMNRVDMYIDANTPIKEAA